MTSLTASRGQATAGGRPGRRRGRSLAQRQATWAWIFALPATIHIFIWTGVPILVAAVLSLTHYDILNPPRWAGIANYLTLMDSPLFWRALWHNLVIAVVGRAGAPPGAATPSWSTSWSR